jgi:hypothetical protein
LTVPGVSGAETRVNIESLFETIENVVPQNSAFFLDRPVPK